MAIVVCKKLTASLRLIHQTRNTLVLGGRVLLRGDR